MRKGVGEGFRLKRGDILGIIFSLVIEERVGRGGR